MIRVVGASVCVLALTGCGGSNPTSATSPTAAFVGTWAEPRGSNSQLQIMLTNAPSQGTLAGGADTVSGNWTITSADATQAFQGGTCTGRVADRTISLLLLVLPAIPGACDETVSGTLDASGARMTGNRGYRCRDGSAYGGSGTLTLVKEQ